MPVGYPITLNDMSRIALMAGTIMKKYFPATGVISRTLKEDKTPVTIADEEINAMAMEQIRKLSSEIDIIGEEGGDRKDSDWLAVFDPVDGTIPYTMGVPISTFMLSLLHKRRPVMSVIYDPFMDCLYTAQQGKGARLNNRAIRVKPTPEGELVTVGLLSWPGCKFNTQKVGLYLEKRGLYYMDFGSIGRTEALVATGALAASIFPGPTFHDNAPGHILVEEAGGRVTDMFGEPIDYTEGRIRGHIMSNGVIHDLLIEAVRASNA